MKTALISVLTATFLGFASLASGRPFDAAEFTAIMFATGLVAWTMVQYNRQPRVLTVGRPIRIRVGHTGRRPQTRAHRLAA